jgi:hypothetical protein
VHLKYIYNKEYYKAFIENCHLQIFTPSMPKTTIDYYSELKLMPVDDAVIGDACN